MELIAMKNFKEFNRVAFDFDKSDAFVYRVSTKEAWASGDGMQVLRIVRAYLAELLTIYYQCGNLTKHLTMILDIFTPEQLAISTQMMNTSILTRLGKWEEIAKGWVAI